MNTLFRRHLDIHEAKSHPVVYQLETYRWDLQIALLVRCYCRHEFTRIHAEGNRMREATTHVSEPDCEISIV